MISTFPAYFTGIGVGERYDRYRPKVHHVVLEWMSEHLPGKRFGRAVDVACGTGDSMVPLLEICDDVLGIDPSDEMLAIARNRGLRVIRSDYGALADHGTFDLISTCMAFHWFDAARATASYKAASAPDAVWLIYNFALGGHSTSDPFNRWFHESYLKRFPSPPRSRSSEVRFGPCNMQAEGETVGRGGERRPRTSLGAELRAVASDGGWLPIEFTQESLVGYLSTQSNIQEASRGGKPLDEIQKELLREIGKIDISGAFKYVYVYEILKLAGT